MERESKRSPAARPTGSARSRRAGSSSASSPPRRPGEESPAERARQDASGRAYMIPRDSGIAACEPEPQCTRFLFFVSSRRQAK